MFKQLFIFAILLVSFTAHAGTPKVMMKTNKGEIVIELNDFLAPKTVENFLQYVDDQFYDGTLFHRVISNFMIQGGGFEAGMKKKPTGEEIENEADNGLKNTHGTIAMARTGNPHSATAQFFINVVDNKFLDYKAPNQRGWGYAVFGKVIKGMDVVDKIRNTPTGNAGRFQNLPTEQIIIESVRRLED